LSNSADLPEQALHTALSLQTALAPPHTAAVPPVALPRIFPAPSSYRARDAEGAFTAPIGSGLFAAVPIRRGETIALFHGEVITAEEARRRDAAGRGGYMIGLRTAGVLDCYTAARAGRCLASMANTANGLRAPAATRGPTNNARIAVSGGSEKGWRVALIATTHVPSDRKSVV
jgi:hypothetical protein